MVWYKIEASHGPGHQSHSVYYQWKDKELDKEQLEDIFDDYFGDTDWPIGSVKKLRIYH